MNEREFQQYQGLTGPTIRATDFADKGDRVLCQGYNVEREDFEVALVEGQIEVWEDGRVERAPEFPAERLRPNKRAYPRDTDHDFAVAMRQAGEELTFTHWDR